MRGAAAEDHTPGALLKQRCSNNAAQTTLPKQRCSNNAAQTTHAAQTTLHRHVRKLENLPTRSGREDLKL
jgi:hypothetical protein